VKPATRAKNLKNIHFGRRLCLNAGVVAESAHLMLHRNNRFREWHFGDNVRFIDRNGHCAAMALPPSS
jgi:hypothetical protein